MIKHIGNICLIVWAVIMALPLAAQDFSHRKMRYQWPDHVESELSLDSAYAGEDAVILYEEYNIFPQKQVLFRYVRIRFLTQEGIDRFNGFSLPQPANVFHALKDIPYEQRDTAVRMYAGETDVMLFAARIIRDDDFEKAVLSEKARVKTELIPYKDRKFAYTFRINNLQPGDELEMAYSCTYGDQYHFIFHDIFPKQEIYISFEESPPFTYTIRLNNDTTRSITKSGKYKNEYYRLTEYYFRNVPKVDFSENQPVWDVWPHFHFFASLQPAEEGGILGKPPAPEKTCWADVLGPLTNFDNYDEYENVLSVDDGETNTTNALFAPFSDIGFPGNVIGFHSYICDSFTYSYDSLYLRGLDFRGEQFKENISKKVLRNIFRFDLYNDILFRARQPYYFTVLQDRRSQQLTDSMYVPLYPGVHAGYAFGPLNDLHYALPKNNRFGYYADEFPYYLQSTKQVLIPQTVPYKTWKFDPESMQFPLVTVAPKYYFPSHRQTGFTFIQREKGDSLFCVTELSGQFSTLGRSWYQYGIRDSSVHPDYAYPFAGRQYNEFRTEVLKKDGALSFSAGFAADSSVLLLYQGDSIGIPFEKLLPFAIPANFDPALFSYGYRPDFVMKEDVIILLETESPVAEASPGIFSYWEKSTGINFRILITQPEPLKWVILIDFDLDKELYEGEDLYKLREVFDAIRELRRKTIWFQRTEHR